MMIPATAHFVWFGSSFPALLGLSLISAAKNGGFNKVVIHCDSDIRQTPGWEISVGCAMLHPLNEKDLFCEIENIGEGLYALYQKLAQPAAKSNMVRLAILYREGGVYMDTDVVTVRDFSKARLAPFFCGTEHIALPAALHENRRPLPWVTAGARLALRDAFRRIPDGWRLFRHIESMYPAIVNNAILGTEPRSDTIYMLLERMLEIPCDKQLERFALGTHLLESSVASGIITGKIYQPEYFYPLGPEISEHWFRKTGNAHYSNFLRDETICVHWYASVRTNKYMKVATTNWIRENRNQRPICSLGHWVLDAY